MAFYTKWAAEYPTARFLVVGIAPEGKDAEPLGWGLAFPEYVFADLHEWGMTGRFNSAQGLVRTLRHEIDVRIVWVDPEPERWRDEDDWFSLNLMAGSRY
jgi:hypothetical protein